MTLTQEELNRKKFEVAQAMAYFKINKLTVGVEMQRTISVYEAINTRTELSDAQTLLRLAIRSLREYNIKLDNQALRVKAMRYTGVKVFESKNFNGLNINFKSIEKAINEEPGKKPIDIALDLIY